MNQAPQENRYWTVDILRGIAATGVAIYHISEVSLATSDGFFSTLLHSVFRYGYLGIAIFFVISGFVIAASTANGPVDFRYFGKFILKRSVRLDPTYWSSIALDVALTVVAIRLLSASTPLPSVEKVLLNMFYLQDLTGVGNIAAIYWTLCLEIQFYIVFCLVLAIDNHLSARFAGAGRKPNFKLWLFAGITLYSMLIAAQLVPTPLQGLFITHWMLFAMGAAVYRWGVQHRENRRAFPLLMLAMFAVVAAQVVYKDAVYALGVGMACATALLLYVGARRGKLGTWLKNDVLLYLGARSYSIYLFHTIVGERAAKLLPQAIYPKLPIAMSGEVSAAITFAVGLGVSLITAEVAYRLIETPSLLLSKRIRPNRAGSPLRELQEPKMLRGS